LFTPGWYSKPCKQPVSALRASTRMRSDTLKCAAMFQDAVVMAPMTKGGNLPYRRLCAGLGATITMGEMALARQLLRGSRSEFALIRRAPDEPFFGAQLAGTNPEDLAEAARLVESRGASFVDLNCGCPIDDMTRRGIGAALLQRPERIRKLLDAMVKAVKIPVTVKIRLGWSDDTLNHLDVARAAQEAGVQAIFVHGRTRNQRYRRSASWEKIGEVVAAVSIPVIGNGDILFPHHAREFRAKAGCAGVMIARAALIKPWIFREIARGEVEDLAPADRLALYARWVALAREHFGQDERGTRRIREFLVWHFGFWCRHVPRRADGTYPAMQEREERFEPRSEEEALLCRNDAPIFDWWADRLLAPDAEHAAPPPPPLPDGAERELIPEG
jgi:tRNA-dihydrouridine synthase 3